MGDYIERQWFALIEGWGATLCRDLQQLLLTWLNQDDGVKYARSCKFGCRCEIHKQAHKRMCWDKHITDRYDLYMVAMSVDGYNLACVKDQTEELCLAAVEQNGYALQFVHNQTKRVVEAALKEQPGAKYYKRHTPHNLQ